MRTLARAGLSREAGRLRVAPSPHAPALAEELAVLRQGGGTISGRGAGHHAELAIALALTMWTQTLVGHGSQVAL
jgi:hypothetical protein